jgi:hypothetical protein
MEHKRYTVNEMLADPGKEEECPIPLSIMPNYMGINLCSVDSISWTQQSDRQLVTVTINFNPGESEA